MRAVQPCKADGLTVADALDRLCAGTAASTTSTAPRRRSVRSPTALAATWRASSRRWSGRSWPVGTTRSSAGRHADAAVEPYLVAEVVRIDEEGDVTLDEGRRTKQPDWTHDAPGRAPTPPTSWATASDHDID